MGRYAQARRRGGSPTAGGGPVLNAVALNISAGVGQFSFLVAGEYNEVYWETEQWSEDHWEPQNSGNQPDAESPLAVGAMSQLETWRARGKAWFFNAEGPWSDWAVSTPA